MAPTLRLALSEAQQQLKLALAYDEREARMEARLLLGHVLHADHAWLIAHESDALPANVHALLQALLQRRLAGEPMAYILGYREFYGLTLQVTPATLIPRPDTETLVEAALSKLGLTDSAAVADLGTGSGAIALTIASQRPLASITAVDASADALAVARSNAAQLALPNVQFLLSDWYAGLYQDTQQPLQFDIIVSNPPYIAAGDRHLSQGDLRFEPASALASGIDGLDAIRHIVQHAPRHLHPHGWLLLEHGYDQAAAVAALLHAQGFDNIQHRHDLGGVARVTLGQRVH